MHNPLKAQPAAISAAVVAVLNALAYLGVLHLSADQISVVNIAVVAVLGLFVHQAVTPVGNVVAYRGGNDAPVAGPAMAEVENGKPVHVQAARTLQTS
jgi:hypothetical protein